VARPGARGRPTPRRDAARVTHVAEDVEIAGTVAIVGFPNVGKSTLVNRLTATRAAVVHETPGVTRDRKEFLCEWSGITFRLIDTGGVDEADTGPFGPQIASQARQAVDEADLVLFVVDAKAGVTPGDEELAQILRSSRRPVLVIANKLDDPRRDTEALEFHRLGLGDPIPVSALHGHGTGDLLDEVVSRLPGRGERPVGEEAIKVAILGRPNVGKSSLLNALLGQDRVIVSEVPGTTRDSIDTVLRRDESTFVLVDTAGLRRKRRQRQGIEYYSELRALEAAERADVALVLVDANQGVVDQDLSVADVARKAQCATIVVLSKWDVSEVRIEDVRPLISSRLRQRPPIIAVSAQTGRGLQRLLDLVETLFQLYAGRIATAELNRALQDLRESRQPPGRRGRRLNLLYGTQVSSRPPRFRIFVNDRGLVTRDYGFWVENELRARFGLEGIPVSIDFVTSQ
jgi:GTPase